MQFRLRYELSKRMGWLAKRFPVNPPKIQSITLRDWKLSDRKWIWGHRNSIGVPLYLSPKLAQTARNILKGNLLLFNSLPYKFTKPEDWIIHPETGYHYDNRKHWTTIPDMSPVAGDIKYVWEKSRFAYLHPVLRYDHHFEEDNADWAFREMESWISQNPINCGPNYRCSQEISLRCFNWMGALSFYSDSASLTEERWQLFMHQVYWQIHHVFENIQFSRIAVRNNHAISETLALYIFGTMFPQWPNAAVWNAKGKAWFEEEIEYQVYPDGTYLQFSMNYHRVVVQLFTLAIRFAEVNGERFSDVVYQRAHQSLRFLSACQDPVSGKLPNYGYNDGALFFQFSDSEYRNYSSQLNALNAALAGKNIKGVKETEEAAWFGYAKSAYVTEDETEKDELQVFGSGGYVSIKETETLTFLRCGRHEDRPAQADNLQIDIWHEGENLIRDAGSYKYNSTEEDIRFFVGSRSHNVLMLNGMDQMQKGPRFVWLHWSQAISLAAREEPDHWKVTGEIMAFRQTGRNIVHRRELIKRKDKPEWEVSDRITGLKGERVEILWHPSEYCLEHFEIVVEESDGKILVPKTEIGWYSSLYGVKEEAPFWVYETHSTKIKTTIRPKS